MSVALSDEGRAGPIARELAARARRMLTHLGLRSEVSLVFVTEARMAALNAEHMGKRGPTDVLSFPQLDEDEALALGYGLEAELAGLPFPARPAESPALLGDVVVSMPVVRRQARAARRPPLDEATMLVAHGLLHLLGYDHRDPLEEALMRARTVWLERVGEGAPPAPRRRRIVGKPRRRAKTRA